MATTSKHSTIFGTEDWKSIYKTYNQADFQSYNFETLRKSFIDYLKQHHPESFNDFVESSEFIALIDLMAFMGQGISFRQDLNTRENFLDTAERRDSVVKLANLVGYQPKRNQASSGYIKVTSISTTENIYDYNNSSLSNVTVRWNDRTNIDWQEQFNTIINAILVDSQKAGVPGRTADILNVSTSEYSIKIPDGVLPVIPFSASVDGISMNFEAVNATSAGEPYIYEPAPKANNEFNLLYRNDTLGFASKNTGYFFYFKQGTLSNKDFVLSDRISNRQVEVDVDGINGDDVWVYELNALGNIAYEWAGVENIYATNNSQDGVGHRRLYSISNRANDQVTLNFGDGVFGNIPVGTYRAMVRNSNGLEYIINKEDISSIQLTVPYVSRTNRLETATFTVSLTENINNARAKESLADIKRRAPAKFYTQNRMVNGEDYNNFPYATFNSVMKSKAINRTNIGASRYLDLVDPTGKYSSINTFNSDGMLYKDTDEEAFTFAFVDTNDIESVIRNQVEPKIVQRNAVHRYYENNLPYSLTSVDVKWHFSTTSTNQTTGYFENSSSNALQIGEYTTDNLKYFVKGCVIKFEPQTGYYFDKDNRLQNGTPTLDTDKLEIWSGISNVVLDGTNFGSGTDADGIGAVTLTDYIPTDAVPTQVYAVYNTDLSIEFEQVILGQIELYRNFGIQYDNTTAEWNLVSEANLTSDNWIAKFETVNNIYTVTTKVLNYYFSSVKETRFFYGDNRKIYDPRTGKVVNDYISILKTNSQPATNSRLTNDVKMDIVGQPVEVDGYAEDYKVLVSFSDFDDDNVADNPSFFDTVVTNDVVDLTQQKVFFQTVTDADNLTRAIPLASDAIVNTSVYAVKADIDVDLTAFSGGEVVYAYTDAKFYQVDSSTTSTSEITGYPGYLAKTGRQDLQFQYRHNSPETRRINPGISNIIDMFLVTSAYYTDYTNYINDTTNTITEPVKPSIDELTVAYKSLEDYKMISDNIVMNSVDFKPLFGDKAESGLQATIKVVKLQGSMASNNEIKSRVISAMNEYFSISNWDFGETFYFSELAAYLHDKVGDVIGSVVITPNASNGSFGDLYEIKSAPNEIFVSAATVNDIMVIDALTSTQLNS